MKLPADLVGRARTRYRSRLRTWVVEDTDDSLSLSLGAPTGHVAEEDPAGVRDWVRAWRAHEAAGRPGVVEWKSKRLGVLGETRIPVRLLLGDVEQIAEFAGYDARLRHLRRRFADFCDDLGSARAGMLAPCFAGWRDWDDDTTARFLAVVDWIDHHDASSFYVRELPIRGVDTKWIEHHRGVLAAVCGEEQLDFRSLPELIEVRSLDSALTIGGFEHVSASAAELGKLVTAGFHTVVVVENRTTFLALPALDSALAIFGSGFSARRLADIPWLRNKRVLYWGDLDTYGFAILDAVRAHLPHAESIFMDPATVAEFADLGVVEPKTSASRMTRLADEELRALSMLRERGDGRLRIEQERIPFDLIQEAPLGGQRVISPPSGPDES